MRPRSYMQASVIVGGFDPVNLGDFHECDPAGTLDGQTLHLSRQISAMDDLLLGTVEGPIESRIVEGLQQVIERPRLESAQCIMVICGHEYDCGWKVLAQQFEHVEAIALRHLHVEED